ncbi:hypothetical protein SNOG_12012 [Parastagonospora nodorum SN15]|uniref:Uncharacterized protein n=1 Tax=Phaeosphaeria nodorum (strain SN15 / ATCC MYA-4574 / FGSC 10173) TaxID=321614 RepID=Q0U8A2_PHANO|nr:hypothetical protein SNOG_12012 [Parastagonospora nodorum SN15]EAT80424.1 hypothetical protein SNOG_12012 [Parastagonospora nodorum SN15]
MAAEGTTPPALGSQALHRYGPRNDAHLRMHSAGSILALITAHGI